jgi:hypothetical protein
VENVCRTHALPPQALRIHRLRPQSIVATPRPSPMKPPSPLWQMLHAGMKRKAQGHQQRRVLWAANRARGFQIPRVRVEMEQGTQIGKMGWVAAAQNARTAGAPWSCGSGK